MTSRIAEQDSLEARLRRTEKRKSYLAMNATAPIIEGEYGALINPDGPEAADTLSQMRDALVEAEAAIIDSSYFAALAAIRAALKLARGEA